MFSTGAMAPLYFALLAAFVTTIGLIAVAVRSDWSLKYSGLFSVLAGAMLVTLVLLHIAPEAMANSARAPVFILVGFMAGLVSNALMRGNAPAGVALTMRQSLMPVAAICLHSLLDGFVYTVTFSYAFEMGIYATVSLILHEFPEGIIAFALLRSAGLSSRVSFLVAFFVSGVTTPLGVLLSLPFADQVTSQVLGDLFAISAGLLLFVATGPLFSRLDMEKPIRSLPALGLGVVIAATIASTHFHGPESELHDHEGPHHDHVHRFD